MAPSRAQTAKTFRQLSRRMRAIETRVNTAEKSMTMIKSRAIHAVNGNAGKIRVHSRHRSTNQSPMRWFGASQNQDVSSSENQRQRPRTTTANFGRTLPSLSRHLPKEMFEEPRPQAYTSYRDVCELKLYPTFK